MLTQAVELEFSAGVKRIFVACVCVCGGKGWGRVEKGGGCGVHVQRKRWWRNRW